MKSNAKEYLSQYRTIKYIMQRKQQEHDELLQVLDMASIDYSKTKVQTSVTDIYANTIARAVDALRGLENDLERLLDIRREVIGVIDKIPDKRFQTALSLYYISGHTVEEIAEIMCYSDRHISRLILGGIKYLDSTYMFSDNGKKIKIKQVSGLHRTDL